MPPTRRTSKQATHFAQIPLADVKRLVAANAPPDVTPKNLIRERSPHDRTTVSDRGRVERPRSARPA